MEAYSQTLQTLLQYEGLYANDSDDHGGETCMGISRKYHPEWSGWHWVDALKSRKDFPACIAQSENIQSAVSQFYYEQYWKPLQGASISDVALMKSLFLFSVNVGIKAAVKALQEVLGCKADGSIGTQTLAALQAQANANVLLRYRQAQIQYYMHICQAEATQRKYLYGWMRRVLFL